MTPYDVQRRELARKAKDSFPTLGLYPWKCKKCNRGIFGTAGRKRNKGGEGWFCPCCAGQDKT